MQQVGDERTERVQDARTRGGFTGTKKREWENSLGRDAEGLTPRANCASRDLETGCAQR